ncbi:MAG: tagaturonate epimerase family protein [Chloroflexota bacterium]|nr:tagaturonate epimerase family protein [Chloroflexota bacterium]
MFPPKLKVLPRSVVDSGVALEPGDTEFALVQDKAGLRLAVQAPAGAALLSDFEGEARENEGKTLLLGPTSPANARALRRHLEWLRPGTLGLRTSAGTGDRLGLATPGHVRAFRAVGGQIAPIFAQQSIREMTRTGRTPQQVMDDATWGIFAEGWRDGVGADADHLKSAADIDACAAAGFTFFTIDPGDHVDNSADDLSFLRLLEASTHLPWDRLDDCVGGLTSRYVGQTLEIEDYRITFDEATVLRAAVKYGRAVAHVAAMYRHLQQAASGWELEVSVDETETPTTHAEHVYIVSELKRLGVQWVSLAPRYIGRFEKAVDYIGDLAAFQADFAVHAAIARHFGPYKLSLHSGSDKFSVYGIAMQETRGLVHLKTAGTSYLEALRTVGALDPALFREIYVFARQRYPTDRASYHVSAELAKAPPPEALADHDLPGLLDQFDARQILHVTFGSVLTTRKDDGGWLFYDRFMVLLRANPETYARNLESHFLRHLKPFAAAAE